MMSQEMAGHHYIYQPGTSGRTLILLHGTGGDENQMIPFGQLLDSQANLLAVRGNVQEHGLNRYFARLAEGVYDWDDLNQRRAGLQSFIYQASQTYGFKMEEGVLVGYSNGANIAVSLLLDTPSDYRQAVLFRPLFPTSDLPPRDLSRSTILQLSGRQDELVGHGQAEQQHSFFIACKAAAEFGFVNQGHQLGQSDIELASQWLGALA